MNRIGPILFWMVITLLGVMTACDPIEEEISGDGGLQLTFSMDTLKFDTILTSVGSITRQFKIYNPNKNAIEIDQIFLGKANQSDYSIIVNGKSSNSFENEVLYGKDSILVLVEVLIDPMDSDLPFLVKDSVVMRYNGNQQDIKLVAWGQDANFIDNEVITCDAIWDSPKPYVIYNSALVDTLCTLTISEGTRIYLDNGAKFYVKGSLLINGTAENKVIIRNTRLDPEYSVAPGQWEAIYFLEGSFNSLINHAEIRNGQIGLRIGNPSEDDLPELTITNTSIGHMSIAGIRAFTSDIAMVNVEVFDCPSELVGLYVGGKYWIDHCTFSNEPIKFSRDQPSVIASDFIELEDKSLLTDDLSLSLTHSIIWGDMDEEFLIASSGQTNIDAVVTNNIIRSANADFEVAGNQISRKSNYPVFYQPFTFNYQIDSLSPARDAAPASLVAVDLLGTVRDEIPDIGAYERKDSIP